MKNAIKCVIATIVLSVFAYTVVGVGTRVDAIKEMAPAEMEARNWEVIRYEGFQYGSWDKHGGKVWYHLKDKSKDDIFYRVCVTMWDNELQYYYGDPEQYTKIDVNIDN